MISTHIITIYGPGCHYCTALARNAHQAVQGKGRHYEIRKVSAPFQIAEAGVAQTPALAIDGKIVSMGKLLSTAQIQALLDEVAPAPKAETCCCSPKKEAAADVNCSEQQASSVSELSKLAGIICVFTALFFLPMDSPTFQTALQATLDIAKWYAQEHTVLCLLPAFFIAGVIAVFISKGAVMRYLGAGAPKWLSYSVAAISGGILSVCSCTVLPLFTSIRKRGAGLGPAIAFLYSGPAISTISIILTARILGAEMSIARTTCAIGFSIIVGAIMAWIYRREDTQKEEHFTLSQQHKAQARSVSHTALLFFSLVAILIFANWAAPQGEESRVTAAIFNNRWYLVSGAAFAMCWSMVEYLRIPLYKVLIAATATFAATAAAVLYVPNPLFVPLIPMLVAMAGLSVILLTDKRQENRQWALATWGFTKQTVPLMALGILVTGFLLGSTHESTAIPGIIPAEWVQQAVGGNSLGSTFIAAFAGAFMYFSSLTEIPIVQGLMTAGMGKGPALALLLAGPSLSLPNMLVIGSVMGWRKTTIYVSLVIALSSLCGYAYGILC